MIRENKWRAARFGIDAELITDSFGKVVPVKKEVEKLIKELEPTAKELGADGELKNIMKIFESGTSSTRQRKVFNQSGGNWNAVIDSLINEFEESWQLKSVKAI